MGHFLFAFLQRIGIGAALVFAILVLIRLGTPRRSRLAPQRRSTD